MDRKRVWALTHSCGGVFKFTVLLQKRVQELVRGAPKLTETSETNPIEIALKEIEEGLVELETMTKDEIEAMRESLEEQAAAQSLLNKEETPGDLSTQAITDFLKSG